ncbi:hypothetical protein FHS18_001723 [Paenibacillus phyllosphaerae]|uniref:Heparinase II/III-like protein n=1 Tax=Paenibacillus phyllosphaerae TaxID=274593 RepID=A0A7W5FLV7_9BACL|nr:hypothetical protein [Paenibacillus phyllosphaerae]MBB3109660.1 hypothetical protein [Paenibacillus phyllosphaerae]
MTIYDKLVAVNDDWVTAGNDNQITDEGSRFYGGVADPDNGIAWPTHTGTLTVMAVWGCALVNPDSRYYHDEELLGRLELASAFIVRFQHADGTISPGWTNLHSPPDTAFAVVGLAQLYELLENHEWTALAQVRTLIRQFLENSVPALLTGGGHTPNHRWVLSAALAFLHRLTGNEALTERAAQWLAEGIDITEDGEWTERSNGIYNGVSDIMLYHAAELLGRPELLEPVRRNLRMMAYLVHPDGEVVTDYSGRQDFGQAFDMSGYFLAASHMAHRDQDPLFAALAKLGGEALHHPGAIPNNGLLGYLLHPQLRETGVTPGNLPEQYKVVINGQFDREHYLSQMDAAGHGGRIFHSRLHPDFGAPVARQRDGATSLTVMTETNSFLALRHGAARLLGVQVSSSFEPGFIKMNALAQQDNGYRLSGEESKGYYGPIATDRLPASAGGAVSPWYLLPHQLREVTHLQHHHVDVELNETEDGWQLRVRCDKPDVLLTQISFVFGKEGTLQGGELSPAETGTQFWHGGVVTYAAGDDWIELDGGAHEHRAKSIRGAAFPTNCQTLVVNVLTPYDRTFHIRLSPQNGARGSEQ